MAGMALRTALSPLMLLLPRLFPHNIFGIFVLLRSVVSVCRQLFGLDFKRGLAWWVSRRQGEGGLRNEEVWSAVAFAVIFSSICSTLIFVTFLIFKDFLPENLRIISPAFLFVCLASIPGMVALDCTYGCMDGIRKPKYSAFGQSLSIGLLPIFAIIMHFLGFPDSLAWSLFVANWLCALIVLWRMKQYFPTSGGKIVLLPDRRLLEYSIPLSLGNWASSGLNNMDLWLVAYLIGPSEAGIYGVMQMLANGVRKVKQSYDPLIVPVVSRMETHTILQKLPEVLRYSTNMVSSLQLLVALFLACFYREILSVSGSQYAMFGTAFILLVASNLVGGLCGISYQVLLGLGKSSMLLKLNLMMMLIAATAGYILIPSFGLTGAASLSLSVSILQTVNLFYLQTRVSGKWLYNKEFLLSIALICGFIATSSLTVSWFADASFLFRVCVFCLLLTCLGTWAFAARKSFMPQTVIPPEQENQNNRIESK